MSDLITLRKRLAGLINRGVALTDEISELLAAGSPVAIGVSGGKDSCAAALATIEHLDRIGHKGPRILVHADLGRVEWSDSLPTCERLAIATGAELVIVRRESGDMMDRWLQRWDDNCARYVNLKCVKLILPWSTPDMRFCTSELKVAVICRYLKNRFLGQTIINADGVRAAESHKRKDKPIANAENALTNAKAGTRGVHWRPILEWEEGDVFSYCAHREFRMHEGYERFNMGRISCVFCIMQDIADMTASISNPEHHPIYREMVDLEIAACFAFQGGRWLGDLAPELLSEEQRSKLADAKRKAARRVEIESRIPKHLEFTKGWPTVMPTDAEAEGLCSVRIEIGELMGLEPDYLTPAQLRGRYAELMAENEARDAVKVAKATRKAARAAKKSAIPAV